MVPFFSSSCRQLRFHANSFVLGTAECVRRSATVCVECLIGKQKKPILFQVTEPSSIPYRTHSACAKRAAYRDPPPVIPVPDTGVAQAAYAETLLPVTVTVVGNHLKQPESAYGSLCTKRCALICVR